MNCIPIAASELGLLQQYIQLIANDVVGSHDHRC